MQQPCWLAEVMLRRHLSGHLAQLGGRCEGGDIYPGKADRGGARRKRREVGTESEICVLLFSQK